MTLATTHCVHLVWLGSQMKVIKGSSLNPTRLTYPRSESWADSQSKNMVPRPPMAAVTFTARVISFKNYSVAGRSRLRALCFGNSQTKSFHGHSCTALKEQVCRWCCLLGCIKNQTILSSPSSNR